MKCWWDDSHPKGSYVNLRSTSVVSRCTGCIIRWAELGSSQLLIGCEPPGCVDCCSYTNIPLIHKWEQLFLRLRNEPVPWCRCDQSWLRVQTCGGWGETTVNVTAYCWISTGRQERSFEFVPLHNNYDFCGRIRRVVKAGLEDAKKVSK